MLSIETVITRVDRIPIPLRAALATVVAWVASRLGYDLTQEDVTTVLVWLLWAALGVADVARWLRARKAKACDARNCAVRAHLPDPVTP